MRRTCDYGDYEHKDYSAIFHRFAGFFFFIIFPCLLRPVNVGHCLSNRLKRDSTAAFACSPLPRLLLLAADEIVILSAFHLYLPFLKASFFCVMRAAESAPTLQAVTF